jgi:glyoxylase-like metal-dependent hydrolase (beta-lactamase superfamily II)
LGKLSSSSEPEAVRLTDSLYRLGPLGSPPVLSSYLIIDEKVALVDCGPRSVIDELIQLMKEIGIQVSDVDYLLLTHIHLDHAGGASRFLEKCSSAFAFVPEKGIKHLLKPDVLNSSAKAVLGDRIFDSWGNCEAVPTDRIEGVEAKRRIELGRTELEYVSATGHAPHQDILVDGRNSIVYAADALGIYLGEDCIIPTTPPPSFHLAQAYLDIQMIAAEHPKICCPAHFGEVIPKENYFATVLSTYEKWETIVKDYFFKNSLLTYDLKNCCEIFERLSEEFPEYQNLSEDLKEQVERVDVAGLLNYFIRKNQAS